MLYFICISQVIIAILAYFAGVFYNNNFYSLNSLFTIAIVIFVVFSSVITYRFLINIRKVHYKSTIARSLFAMLSEADEVIIVDNDLKIIYAKHLPQNFLKKTFDFELIIKNQFIDNQGSINKCCKSITDGIYFEDVFTTTKNDNSDPENHIWVRVLPLYVGSSISHRAIIMSDITIHRNSIIGNDRQYLKNVQTVRYLDKVSFGIICLSLNGNIIWANATAESWIGDDLALIGNNISKYTNVTKSMLYDFANKKDFNENIIINNLDKKLVNLIVTKITNDHLIISLFKTKDSSKVDDFANIPIPLVKLTKDGHICLLNDSAKNILTFINVGNNILNLLQDVSKDMFVNALEAKINHPIEIKFLNADLSFCTYIKEDDDGNIVLQLVDTTEQKKIEQQFAQAQKIQAVGQLAGGVAHDFNNLLTAIIGFCDLLLQRLMPNDPSFADVMQIKQNANRASNLVKQLLAFSRRQSLQPRTINVKNLLSEISSLLRRLIGSQINFRVINEKKLWLVKADVSQFEQMIINLVVNARDAMDGKGDLTIETLNYVNSVPKDIFGDILARGEYVLIKISDTGCGIPKEIVSSIFDPFFSTKEIGKGTGLGLATVYGIVKQTGGAIEVESEVARGSVFKIYLPRSLEEEIYDENKVVINDVTGSETIMFVEDEDAIRIFASRALRDKGYRVIEAPNGEVALSLIEEGAKPDILITDVSMPKVDGPTLRRELQKKMPKLPVIFTSGYAEETFRQNLSEDKTIHFLPKPFSIRDLASKIREVIGK